MWNNGGIGMQFGIWIYSHFEHGKSIDTCTILRVADPKIQYECFPFSIQYKLLKKQSEYLTTANSVPPSIFKFWIYQQCYPLMKPAGCCTRQNAHILLSPKPQHYCSKKDQRGITEGSAEKDWQRNGILKKAGAPHLGRFREARIYRYMENPSNF